MLSRRQVVSVPNTAAAGITLLQPSAQVAEDAHRVKTINAIPMCVSGLGHIVDERASVADG